MGSNLTSSPLFALFRHGGCGSSRLARELGSRDVDLGHLELLLLEEDVDHDRQDPRHRRVRLPVKLMVKLIRLTPGVAVQGAEFRVWGLEGYLAHKKMPTPHRILLGPQTQVSSKRIHARPPLEVRSHVETHTIYKLGFKITTR